MLIQAGPVVWTFILALIFVAYGNVISKIIKILFIIIAIFLIILWIQPLLPSKEQFDDVTGPVILLLLLAGLVLRGREFYKEFMKGYRGEE